MRSPRAAADIRIGMEINPKVRWPFQTVLAMWTLLRQQAGTVHELFKISRPHVQESRLILGRWFISQLDVSLHGQGGTQVGEKSGIECSHGQARRIPAQTPLRPNSRAFWRRARNRCRQGPGQALAGRQTCRGRQAHTPAKAETATVGSASWR